MFSFITQCTQNKTFETPGNGIFETLSAYGAKTITLLAIHCTGAFCQFPFWWICYYVSNKSTGKETGKMHLCALVYPVPNLSSHIRTATESAQSDSLVSQIHSGSQSSKSLVHMYDTQSNPFVVIGAFHKLCRLKIGNF